MARPLRWQQLVISLQRAGLQLHVGGPSALAVRGWTTAVDPTPVRLFGKSRMPAWAEQVRVREPVEQYRFQLLPPKVRAGIDQVQWGPWDWSLWISSPERALLECMALLPDRLDFTTADRLFAGAGALDTAQLTALLGWSKHVQVNRLFLWFADRHAHAWNESIDRSRVFVGAGKRQVVPGGKLDRRYRITVPAELVA
jgi:hypothetical protein